MTAVLLYQRLFKNPTPANIAAISLSMTTLM